MPLCSIAVAAGVIGVVALVKRLAFRRRFGGSSCGPLGRGYGHGHGHGHGHRLGRSFWLRSLFERLDTTPGQEKEIRSAIEDFQQTARGARAGVADLRTELSRAIAGEAFDDNAVANAGSRVDAMSGTMKDAFTEALKRIHSVLDGRQRERLADILQKGPRFGRSWGNPYRDGAH